MGFFHTTFWDRFQAGKSILYRVLTCICGSGGENKEGSRAPDSCFTDSYFISSADPNSSTVGSKLTARVLFIVK